MHYRQLGRTTIQVSALSLGAGPVSTVMVGDDHNRQREVLAYAVQKGVNWIDTAATYGGGQSEQNLGRLLRELPAASGVHLATKVRLAAEDLADIPAAVRRSLLGSLGRLGVERVTLLQLHNSVTAARGDEPTSITPDDVLAHGGVLEAFRALQSEGLIEFLGLTGIGQPASLRTVIQSGGFDTIQIPYHLLNPSAGRVMGDHFAETDYGNLLADCHAQQMGILAIRVLAGGALAGNPPSPHTLKTPFFPLALYERDRAAATRLQTLLGEDVRLPILAVRFVLADPRVHSAIVGFGDVAQIDAALAALAPGPAIDWEEILTAIQGDATP